MSDPIPLDEIPTLSLLYKLKRIEPVEDAEELYKPNAAYNEKISVIRQDITTLAVDSIVNAANNSLLGGGGVDGAIHRAAGPELLEECETLDGCATGSAKITDGYELPAKKVIHAVGPIYFSTRQQKSPQELLSGCYRTSLELAVSNGLKSIAFSALSTGVYGYPSDEASEVALETVRTFFEEGKADELDRVIFCNFLPKDEHAYFENLPKYFPPAEVTESEETAEDAETSEEKATATGTEELATKLPDAPTTEPKDPEEPSPKKQKIESADEALEKQKGETTEDEYVVVDKEEAKGAAEAGVAPPKADP